MDLIDDDPQLRESLHAAVAGGPPSPPLEDLLGVARSARRRRDLRRTTGGLAVAAALAAVAATGAQLLTSDTGGGRTDDGVVADQSPQVEPLDLGVHVTRAGRLVAEPGTTILRTVADPLDRRPDGRSWGVVVERDLTERWGLVDWTPAGTMASVEPAEARFAAFDDWLDYEVAATTGTEEPHPVYFDEDGVLAATGSTKLVRTQAEVDLGQDPAADVLTGAAEITVDGDRRFVLARQAEGNRPRYLVLVPDQDTPTFEDLLAHAADLYAARAGAR